MPDKRLLFSGLTANIVIPVALALATNGMIFALGWTQPDHDIQPDFAPPGYVIGLVWTILFACMGASRWQVARADPAKASWLSVLIAACLAYPFYTLGLQDRSVGLGGIVATFIFAAITALRVRKSSPKAALLLLPLLAWLCFAFVLVITVLRLNHA